MKKLLFLSLFLISTASFAQKEKDVEAAVEKLRLNLIDPTLDGLQQLTTEDLTYGHSTGYIEDQSEFIEALVSGKSDFRSADVSEQSIVMKGNKLALVRHTLTGETMDGDKANPVNIGILQVWVKEKGSWKLASRQAFKL